MALSKIKGTVIADDAITSDKVADGVISAADVADGTLTNAKLADGTIENAKLADNTITGAKLATDIAISTSGILKVDTIQDQSGNNIINENADTITIGASGDTVNVVGTLQNNGSAFAQGITMADSWRLAANTNLGTDAVISTNWEQVDESRSAEIGTALTESSGVFTLPQTGVYLIIYSFCINIDSRPSAGVFLEFTDNNSTFDNAAFVFAGNISASLINLTAAMPFMFGITDTANQKFRFSTSGFLTNEQVRGDTNLTESGFSIVRLGDI